MSLLDNSKELDQGNGHGGVCKDDANGDGDGNLEHVGFQVSNIGLGGNRQLVDVSLGGNRQLVDVSLGGNGQLGDVGFDFGDLGLGKAFQLGDVGFDFGDLGLGKAFQLGNIGFDFGDVRLGGDGIAEGIAKRVEMASACGSSNPAALRLRLAFRVSKVTVFIDFPSPYSMMASACGSSNPAALRLRLAFRVSKVTVFIDFPSPYSLVTINHKGNDQAGK